MAKNILNMVLWHPEMEKDHTKISYIHRGAPGNIKTIQGTIVDRIEDGFLVLNEITNPFSQNHQDRI